MMRMMKSRRYTIHWDGYNGIVLEDVAGNDGYDGGGERDGNKERTDGGDGIGNNTRRRDVDFVNVLVVGRSIGEFEERAKLSTDPLHSHSLLLIQTLGEKCRLFGESPFVQIATCNLKY